MDRDENRCRGKPPKISVGSTYGHLYVLKLNSDAKTCRCRCICSNEIELPIKDITSRRKLTCGCRTKRSFPLKQGMVVREVKLLKRISDSEYPSGKKKRWLVECINCKKQRIVRETDIVTQKIGLCPVCKNEAKENNNEKEN